VIIKPQPMIWLQMYKSQSRNTRTRTNQGTVIPQKVNNSTIIDSTNSELGEIAKNAKE
jgi:hypothetical protein